MAALLQNHSDEIPQGMPGIISDLTDLGVRFQEFVAGQKAAQGPVVVLRFLDWLQDQVMGLSDRAQAEALKDPVYAANYSATYPSVVSKETPGVPG